MAVQAQCPSNILFLTRNVQEGKINSINTNTLGNDYTLPPRGGAAAPGFITSDQSHMLLNNGVVGINPRKRGRDATGGGGGGSVSQINPFSLHNQPSSQIIDLSQIHSSPPNVVVSTGLRLAFGNQQLHQQQQQQQQQSMSTQSSSVLFSVLSEELAAQIRQQRDDIDRFLQAQGEQLRRALAEKRQRHYGALLGAAEESLGRRMREKEVEVEKAVRRHAELEARASQLGAETQLWQARAKAQEAAAISLQAQLQQAMAVKSCNAPPGCSVEETGCEGQGGAEDAESAYIDPDRVVVTGSGGNGQPICKACKKRVASVVLLPCRHLCLCTSCDAMAQSCPLCSTFRSSSVEVFLS